jgi:hypothetical protein
LTQGRILKVVEHLEGETVQRRAQRGEARIVENSVKALLGGH